MNKLLKIILVLSFSLLCFSCYYDEVLERPDLPVPEDVSFQNEIQPIFNTSCVACHNEDRDPDLRAGNAYAALINGNYVIAGDADNSQLYNDLPGVGHPVNVGFSLSDEDIALIRAWINEGAQNN